MFNALCRFKKETPLAYVHSYYSTCTWREIYASEVMPVPDPSDWLVPPDIEARVVGTPKNPRQAGRPKEKRMQKEFQKKSVPTEEGPIVDEGSSGEGIIEEEGPTGEVPMKEVPKKGVRNCSRCHKEGHYSRTCEAFIQVTQEGVAGCSQAGVKRRRKPKKCTICGVVGHTRKTCTDPNRFA